MILVYGGMDGVRDEGALDSCLAQPKTDVFGVERFATLVQKAAAYCFLVVRNHPFFDGNKRAGFVAAMHFLRINNVQAQFDADEAYKVVIGVARGETGFDDVVKMVASAVARAESPLGDGASHA